MLSIDETFCSPHKNGFDNLSSGPALAARFFPWDVA